MSEEWLHKGMDDVIRWPVSKDEIKNRFKLFARLSTLKKGKEHPFETDLYNLINTSSASVWSVDKDLNFISTNKSYRDFCRNVYQTIPRTGEPAMDVLPGSLKNLWNENYQKAFKGKKVVFEYSEVVKNKLAYFEVFLRPIKDNDKVIRIFVYRYNISSLKEYQRKLEEANALLKKSQAIGKMGFLFWDLETNQIELSDEIYKLYGLHRGETCSMPDFVAKVCHPDDLDYVNQNLLMAIRNIKDYDIEHRIVRPDGQIIWVHAKAQLLFDEQGKAVTLLGTIQDITERKKTQDELVVKEENLKTILNSIGDGVIATDAKSRIKLMNPVAEALTEWTESEALNQPLENILHVIDENTRKRIT
ncbi:MAG: PAS domain S-box protein, partial [Chlorobi bacterium]|nr:PAS domain S-box protein [Chlorobiota bacterium]